MWYAAVYHSKSSILIFPQTSSSASEAKPSQEASSSVSTAAVNGGHGNAISTNSLTGQHSAGGPSDISISATSAGSSRPDDISSTLASSSSSKFTSTEAHPVRLNSPSISTISNYILRRPRHLWVNLLRLAKIWLLRRLFRISLLVRAQVHLSNLPALSLFSRMDTLLRPKGKPPRRKSLLRPPL